MAGKLLCACLLAVTLLGGVSRAQYFKIQPTQQPQRPAAPPIFQPQVFSRPVAPLPQWPQPLPQDPQRPGPFVVQPPRHQHPQPGQQKPRPAGPYPQIPQRPRDPQQPQQPQQPQTPIQTCDVAAQYKIHCGLPGITASQCQDINCCFDGQMCYYGKAVTLQCTKDAQFILVIARDATLPLVDLESVHFLGSEQSCQAVGTTAAFAIYQFPVTACGTTVTEDDTGTLTYENRLSSSYEVAIGPYGAITRDSQFDVMIQCKYTGTSVEALVFEVDLLPNPSPVAAPGPLRVELRLGNGQCTVKGCVEQGVAYNSYYQDSDYPVTKVLRDPVYVEVRMLERTDPNLVLTLGRCWATSSPYPDSMPQWDLLNNGCPYSDDRYLTTLVPVGASPAVPFPTHYRRFIFKMFTFVASGPVSPADPTKKQPSDTVLSPLQEMVYIHCNTAVCNPTAQGSCEPQCFRKRRHVAASMKRDFRPESVTVTSHGIIIMDPEHQ